MGSQLYENLPESQLLPQLNGGDSPPAGGLPWDWIQCVHDIRPEGVEITQGTGQGALQKEGASLQAVPTSVVLGPWDGVPLPSLPEGLWEAKGPHGRREENPGILGEAATWRSRPTLVSRER